MVSASCTAYVTQVELRAEQLDVLAILFTCVKVLYVGGAIQRTLRLIEARRLPKPICGTIICLHLPSHNMSHVMHLPCPCQTQALCGCQVTSARCTLTK